MNPPLHSIRAVCFDWGGTLMSEHGPEDIPMALWPEVHILPGAMEAVTALAGRLPLAIASNASVSGRPQIEQALDRVGLGKYFDHIFCFTELGFRKTQVEFWNAASARLAVPLAHIAMVGDSRESDAQAPRAWGVQGVWLAPQGTGPAPNSTVPVVHQLSEFSRWVLDAV